MQSNMSVLGLYTYDNTLFANMNYPEGFETADQTNLINNLLCELAEMEVLYTSPAFMKTIIGVWSYKEKPTWDRIYAAAQMEYNPIENYDRQESSTDTTDATRKHTGNDVTAFSGSDSRTNSGKDTTQDSGTEAIANTGTDATTHGGTDTTTNKVAGFDSNTLVDHDSSALAHGHTESLQHGHTMTTTFGKKEELTHGHVETVSMGHSETLTHGEQIKDDTEITHTSRIHGNIGVTTSQQMLESELELAPKLNIMNIIIESFKNRFCLLVY